MNGEGSPCGASSVVRAEVVVSPLAEAVYAVLRLRPALPEPRITYAELARQLRDRSEAFATVSHRSRELYAALDEIGRECRRLRLPPLPALVVRADTKRPGDAYRGGPSPAGLTRGQWVAVWRADFEAVKAASYPAREGYPAAAAADVTKSP
jgi:hypothetical protein